MAQRRRALAERRKTVGHTQEQLAYLLGVERSTVVRWEAGATEPSPWCRPKLARVLAISLDELHDLLGKDETSKATRPGTRSRLAGGPLSGDAADERLDEIAAVLGLTTGRITQLKSPVPAAERAFFGARPVTVAIPLRAGVAQRKRMVIAAEDSATVDQLETVLADYALASSRGTIAPETTEPPGGDAIVVCGPKSAPVGAWLLDRDPRLGMVEEDGVWSVLDRTTGQRHPSPADGPRQPSSDIAYFARHVIDGRIVLHIAGIHAAGSLADGALPHPPPGRAVLRVRGRPVQPRRRLRLRRPHDHP